MVRILMRARLLVDIPNSKSRDATIVLTIHRSNALVSGIQSRCEDQISTALFHRAPSEHCAI